MKGLYGIRVKKSTVFVGPIFLRFMLVIDAKPLLFTTNELIIVTISSMRRITIAHRTVSLPFGHGGAT